MKKYIMLFLLMWCVVAQAEMVNRYSFTDGDTTAVDSISGKDGILTNTAKISGNKLVLDGSSAANLPSDVLATDLVSVTIEAWFQDDSTANNWSRLFDFGQSDGGNGGQGLFCVAQQYGTTRFTVATNGLPSWATGENTVSGPIHPGEETHVACVWDGPGAEIRIYINGQLAQANATTMDLAAAARSNAFIGDSSYTGDPYFTGFVDEFRIYNTALTDEEILSSFNDGPDAVLSTDMQSQKPFPKNTTSEVSIDVGEISWTSGQSAYTHNVFFGTDEASVTNATVDNPLGTTVFQGLDLDSNSVALDRLEYATTYYWRVDEVNAPSAPGIFTGKVWSFKTELKGYPISPDSIIDVTSYGALYPDVQEPNSTFNGKGLDANDMHSTEQDAMWLGWDDGTGSAFLQYEFDMPYRMYDMLVWNYNEESPNNEFFGAQNVDVAYSLDGENWTSLENVPEFNIATGDNTCVANTQVLFGGAAAKYVKLTFLTGWGGMGIYGVSEVRFSAEPTRAREPGPEDAVGNVAIGSVLSWKAGRYSVEHNVYISTDVNAVTDGTADVTVSDVTNIAPALDLGKTYYWRVDEVNNAEAYPVWDGLVWSFSTASAIVIDDFEVGYDDSEANAVWATWIDGLGNSAHGGSQMGNDASPFLSTTNHSGRNSAPMKYNNTGATTYSEVTAQSMDLQIGTTDWSPGSPTALVIWFRGNAENTPAQLYVKLNNSKVLYDGDPVYLTQSVWRPFVVDLSKFNVNIGNITSITIGVENAGTGTVLLDDISLYAVGPEIAEAVNPGNVALIASYSMENNVQDGSSSGLNGTIIGTPTYVQGLAGYGMALQLNGTGTTDCVDLGNKAAFNPAGSFSVSLWANITTWTSGWGNVMIGNRGESGIGWQLRRYSNSNFCFTTRGINNDDTNSNGNPPLNEWVNITCVYDSAAHTKTIYFDGVLNKTVNTSATNTVIAATTHNTYIGARANSGNTGPESYFIGMLDEIRIYDRALSAGEAAYLADPTP